MNSKKIVKICVTIVAVILLLAMLLVAAAFVFDFEDRLAGVFPFVSGEDTGEQDDEAVGDFESSDTDAYESESDESEPDESESDESEPNESESDESDPDESEPDESESDESEPDESESDESEPDESEPDESEQSESEQTEPEPTEPEPTEPKPTEPKPTEPKPTEPKPTEPKPTEPKPTEPDLSEEGSALEEILKPAQITVLRPVASGVHTQSNSEATIDYSNTADGYLMAKYLSDPGVRLKVQVTGPCVTYTYNITPGEWTVFPLSDGNGNYVVKVYRNVADNRYATVLTASFNATMKNEFAPFLRPNQYVNYENMPLTASTASSVVSEGASMLEKVKAVYGYVVNNISYDYVKASSVQSGYLPDLDEVIASKKGICFDYAALMTGMLRVLDVPCKLVVGYAGTEYHAWISVWSQETGWIDGAIYFNGTNWQTMDPTFAASGSADLINKLSYTSKYIY